MKVTLAFYKESKSFYAKLTRWWTNSDYSHVEIIIGDKWISSGSNFNEGVSIKDLKPLKESYDYIDVDVDGRRLTTVMKFIKNQQGTKYDWLGVFFGGGLDIDVDKKDRWYCSEICAEILYKFKEPRILKYNEPSSKINPEDLFRVYKDLIES